VPDARIERLTEIILSLDRMDDVSTFMNEL
jgi:hypothetical protein